CVCVFFLIVNPTLIHNRQGGLVHHLVHHHHQSNHFLQQLELVLNYRRSLLLRQPLLCLFYYLVWVSLMSSFLCLRVCVSDFHSKAMVIVVHRPSWSFSLRYLLLLGLMIVVVELMCVFFDAMTPPIRAI